MASLAILIGASAAWAQSDVTAPGDSITGTSANNPSAEGVANVIDNNPATKFLNFDKLNVGFRVTPSTGPRSIVTGISLTSANDAPERDPASYTLEGSQDGYVWTLISSGAVAPFATRAERQQIDFANAAAYRHYRLIFPTIVNDATANSMQIAEVELIGTAVMPVAPYITSASSQLNPNAITLTFDRNVGAGSYAVDNGVVVSGTSFGASQNVVVLDVSTTPLVYNTVYAVTVTGLGTDPDPVVYSFRHGEGVIQGAITRRMYMNIPGGAVADLTSNAKFPCAANSIDNAVASFEFGTNPGRNNAAHPNNTEEYGAWVQGMFVAPATGNYRFGLAADDGAALYLSTDINPANKVLLTAQSVWNASREYVTAPGGGTAVPLSPLVPLVEGQRYYMEGLVKEGGGGDHIAVAVQVPGGPDIVNGQEPIPSSMFAPVYWGDCGRTPFTYLGPVSIVQNIQDKAVLEASVINYRVMADGSPSYSYQWYSNDVAIAGANGAALSFVARPSANNAEFYVVVQNSFSSVTSAVSTVSVTPTPQVTSVSTRFDPTSIYVAFSKPVRATEALDAASYFITNSAGVALGIANISYLGSSNQTVKIELTAPLAIGQSLGVVVSEIRDTDGNIMTPNPTVAQLTHAQGVNAPQGLTRKIYLGIAGGAVTDLTGNAKFPCAPDETDPIIPNFEYGTAPQARNNLGRGDTGDYGTWIYGIFVPPTTGNYQFGMAADDGAALYLSTDASPANKVLLTSQGAWNSNRDYVTAAGGGTAVPLSPVIQLQAGQRYYMEGLAKEGGGGDHIAVTVRKPGDPAIVNGQEPISRNLFGTNYSIGCPPTFFFSTLGPVFLTQQPVNQNVFELAPAVFQVSMDGAPPYTVQWYSNDVAVAGATGSRYAFNPLRYANNAQYYAVVQNGFSAQTSSVVTLTVTSDEIAPTLLGARGTQGRHEAVLSFSEPLNLATATNLANYSITNSAGVALAISSVRAVSSSNVVITTDLHAQGERYTVVVNNVQDVAGVPNTIAANSTVSFSGFVYTPGFALMEVYNTAAGNTVNILTTNANYPYFPRERYFITRMNSRLGYPDDTHESYGGRISGLFVPPTNGNYIVRFSSDDDGLFRGSADESPTNIAVSVPLPGCCAAWGDAGRQTPPLPLAAGSRYYYELIWKEGTGGDYAAGTLDATDPLPNAVGTVNAGVQSPFLAIYANPDDTQISLTQTLPANIDTVANQYLGLTVNAMNTAGFPQIYQWQRWDAATSTFTNIPGASGPGAGTYIYGPTTPADNGIQIRVIAYAPGVSAVSTTTIAVNPDTEAPRLVSASGNATLEQVLLTFSEPMDPTSAGDPLFYYLTDGTTEIYFLTAVVTSPTNVLLTVDPSTGSMAEGTEYTAVVLEGVYDSNGNLVDLANNTADFTSWVRTPLTAKYEFYLGIGGGVVNDLLNNAKYPNRPDVTYFTNSLDWPQSSPDMNDYGLRMSGYFRPPVSGNYTFYLKYDDGARFQLSTDQSAANLQTLIDVGCCSGTFAQPRVVSLAAGNAYYFEVIVKEAGGGDYLTLGVTPPGGTTPVPVDGGYLTNAINPIIVTINPGIQTQPQSQEFTEGGSATFSVVVTNAGGFGALYQWQVDSGAGFVDIAGATGSSYSTGPLPLSADGNAYRVLINAPGKMLTSAAATVTINADDTAPTVISVASANGTQIGVQFSEPIDMLSGEEEFNYLINGNLPTTATLRGDGSQVVLIVDTPVEGEFTVEIQNIFDRASTPNALALTNIVGSRWIDTVVDIGNPNPPGQHFSAAEGDIEIIAGGNDVWGTSDQFTYAYRPQTGDFDVRVRVDSIQYVGNAWSKAGLNIRESVDPGSRMFWFYPTPTQGANAFEGAVRPNSSVDVIDFGQPRPATFFPAYLRAVRSGSVFTAYLSQDGQTWNLFGTPQNLPQFPATVLVGVGAVSHVDGVSSAAKFSDFTIVAKLGATIAGGNVTIVWDGEGVLQYADNIAGPWTDLPAATSPYAAPADQPQRFYRVVVPPPPPE